MNNSFVEAAYCGTCLVCVRLFPPVVVVLMALLSPGSCVYAMSNTAGKEGLAQSAQTITRLSDLKWQYRVILIDARVEAAEPKSMALYLALQQHKAGILERHIAWFAYNGSQIQHNLKAANTVEFTKEVVNLLSEREAKVVLIGKDGGVKLVSQQLELERLFDLIDSMPMRREEMRR